MQLNDAEKELIENYRKASQEGKQIIAKHARLFAKENHLSNFSHGGEHGAKNMQ